MIRVLVVGPAVNVRGGISRVIGKIKDHFPPHIDLTILPTYPEQTKYGEPDWWYRFHQFFIFSSAFLRLSFLAAFQRNVIFHVHLSERGSALRKGIICVVLRSLGASYVLHSHAAGTEMFHQWMPKAARRVLIWGFSGASTVIVLTQFWRQYYSNLLKIPPGRLIILPNPCDLPASIPDRSARTDLNLLFLGRVGERKGAFDLIRAFSMVPIERRSVLKLILAGDGAVDQARALAREVGCENYISVLGWVSSSQVAALLEEADLFLLPSSGEGMSVALLEALGAGLPVITTSVGGSDEFLQNNFNAILIQPGSVKLIKEAIYHLAADPLLRAKLGYEARRTATRFGLDHYIADLTGIYEQISGNRAQSTVQT